MESIASLLPSAIAPSGAPAPRAAEAPPVTALPHGTARSEPATGGTRDGGPRMVPLDEFATPHSEQYLPQPSGEPYATHGPLPPLHFLTHQSPAYAAAPYPTPGVAYVPYTIR